MEFRIFGRSKEELEVITGIVFTDIRNQEGKLSKMTSAEARILGADAIVDASKPYLNTIEIIDKG